MSNYMSSLFSEWDTTCSVWSAKMMEFVWYWFLFLMHRTLKCFIVSLCSISHFEYTPECVVFDLLEIPLVHGWLVDPNLKSAAEAVSTFSYNQLVERIIENKNSKNEALVTEGQCHMFCFFSICSYWCCVVILHSLLSQVL